MKVTFTAAGLKFSRLGCCQVFVAADLQKGGFTGFLLQTMWIPSFTLVSHLARKGFWCRESSFLFEAVIRLSFEVLAFSQIFCAGTFAFSTVIRLSLKLLSFHRFSFIGARSMFFTRKNVTIKLLRSFDDNSLSICNRANTWISLTLMCLQPNRWTFIQ